MDIGNIIVCIYNNNIYWPSLKVPLTVNKKYVLLKNTKQINGGKKLQGTPLYVIIDDDNERHAYNTKHFISLNEYRERILNKLLNG